jgi:hypothetical protein
VFSTPDRMCAMKRIAPTENERPANRLVPARRRPPVREKRTGKQERPSPERVDSSSDTTREKSTGNIISKAPSVTSVAGGVLV